MQDILENFEFRNQISRLSKADALGTLIEKLTSPEINLSPEPVKNSDGSTKHPGLDNHGMGSIFEELLRKFNEENNEEAGEHWTPRDPRFMIAHAGDPECSLVTRSSAGQMLFLASMLSKMKKKLGNRIAEVHNRPIAQASRTAYPFGALSRIRRLRNHAND